jgi:hypothetical protein
MDFVYFIQAGHDGPIKIGFAVDPAERLAMLQTGNHVELFLAAAMPGGIDLEQELHARFAEGRIRGEWFRPDTPGLLDAIAEASHIETLYWIADEKVCEQCRRQPVLRRGAKFCSEECAAARARERSRNWKRDAKAEKSTFPPLLGEKADLQGKGRVSGGGGNRTRETFLPLPAVDALGAQRAGAGT